MRYEKSPRKLRESHTRHSITETIKQMHNHLKHNQMCNHEDVKNFVQNGLTILRNKSK